MTSPPIRQMRVIPVERPLVRPFATARGARTHQAGVVVAVTQEGATGRGETSGLPYAGETARSSAAAIEAARAAVEAGATRVDLLTLMAAGGARAALDAALWDLEAKLTGRPAWRSAGLTAAPTPALTAFTISLDAPDAMADQARAEAARPLLKLKLGGGDGRDAERAAAVRAAAPRATLIADANAGCAPDDVAPLAQALAKLGFALLEQPLPAGSDAHLDGCAFPLPLCADESFATAADFDRVAGRYQIVNIKLDKCGGLTSALALRDAARARGLGVFVGCMLAGALSIAPAFLVAQGADYVDLDGPLWLAEREARLETQADGRLIAPGPEVWG